jgi:hypothetical protein
MYSKQVIESNALLKTGLQIIKIILCWCVQDMNGVLRPCHEELTSTIHSWLQVERLYHLTSKHSATSHEKQIARLHHDDTNNTSNRDF